MEKKRFFYLIQVQYLGYRFHGWQHQPGLKTVEGMIRKTMKFVLDGRTFKVLGASRTDAMVSASTSFFELFLDQWPLENPLEFLQLFNQNLPPDIRAVSLKEVDAGFNVIRDSKEKEYLYFFAFGQKSHPFASPFLATFQENLDLDLMKETAALFEGSHFFGNYCTKPKKRTIVEREISVCHIQKNTEISASFFPEKTFMLRIRGAGFLRNQIRLMMGNIVLVGRGELTLEDIRKSLLPEVGMPARYIAPASGLLLNRMDFHF